MCVPPLTPMLGVRSSTASDEYLIFLSGSVAARRLTHNGRMSDHLWRLTMIRTSSFAVPLIAAAVLSVSDAAFAQDVPAEYQQVLSTLGKQGDFKDNVLKVNIPRNDLKVTVAGVATP